MPIVEAGSPPPEWLNRYHQHCVIKSLESMFGQMLGRSVRAPQAVYQCRLEQVLAVKALLDEKRRGLFKPKNLWGFLQTKKEQALILYYYSLLTHDPVRILNGVMPIWLENDPELTDLLVNIELRYVCVPYWRLEKYVLEGYPTAVTLTFANGNERVSHMFHLGKNACEECFDVSDEDPLRRQINQYIIFGQIIDLVENPRQNAGHSGLVIFPKC